MSSSFLQSKEWCDLVFEGRNKEYGAYVLRRDTGRRYRRVAMFIGGVLFAVFCVLAVMGYYVYESVVETIEEIEEEVKQLKPLEEEKKKVAVSAGRRAVANASPNATRTAPDIVEDNELVEHQSGPIGVIGPEDIEIVDAIEIADRDLEHNTLEEDLPVEGVQLLNTEKVEEMPHFPGGLEALMKFMSENVNYPEGVWKQKKGGTVIVEFIIDPQGNLIEPAISQPVDPVLDAAVLAAVRRMPPWRPGTEDGKPIYAKVCIPVEFDWH